MPKSTDELLFIQRRVAREMLKASGHRFDQLADRFGRIEDALKRRA